ncbi:MAG: dethiobiotin synthase [Succinivibrio sp.]|nr:dethiobiotin synthase [Succinivibrio sp.]
MRAVFVTGTGTDIGKTYVSAVIARTLHERHLKIGYYKAAVSGADSIEQSDAGFVNTYASLGQDNNTLLSYLYKRPLSPHLAARYEQRFADLDSIKKSFLSLSRSYDYVLSEGAGGIVCPVVYEPDLKLMYSDILKSFGIPTLVVADAGLGTINHTVLTISYLKKLGITVNGVILNRYDEENMMHCDNLTMIEQLSEVNVIGVLPFGSASIKELKKPLEEYFEEPKQSR